MYEEAFFRDIESILRISRRMIGRKIKRLEIVVIPLNLGTRRYLETHTDKYILNLVKNY